MKENNLDNEIRVKTKEDWLKVLENEEKINENKILEILKFVYMSKDHITNCGTISEYLNIEVAGINSIVSAFGKRVLELLSLPEVKGNSGQNRRWNIPFKTNFARNKNGIFTWELRSELVAAIEEKYNDWHEKYIIQNYGKHLIRYERYSRRDIHDYFSPNTNFTPGAGDWGRSGIIHVPDTISDYVFIVTYGRSQGGYEFIESIDENGILEWQCQPRQKINDKRINAFINHDYNKSNIYLFLRENEHLDYSYLGKLAYVSHDNERENPVHFKWQILDWEPSIGKISLDKNIKDEDISKKIKETKAENDLDQIDPNDFIINFVDTNKVFAKVERKGQNTAEFNNITKDFIGEAEKNTKLGNKGEDVVVSFEKKHLNQIGRSDLADQVAATRNIGGNAESFDVLSFEDNGAKKYIEVKTTQGGANNAFHISEKEVSFSETFKKHYYLYRLYNFNKINKTTDLIIIKGPLDRKLLRPEKYICNIGNAENIITKIDHENF